MWDEPEDEETESRRTPRSRPEDPLDLPLRPGSEAAALLSTEGPPPKKSTPKPRAEKLPEWAPPRTAPPDPARLVPERRVAPSLVSRAADPAPPGAEEVPLRPAIGARALAGLLDAAVLVLVAAVTLLSIRIAFGLAPGARPLLYGAAFAAELSFVALSLSLFLFGRTPGLALASLRAEEAGGIPLRLARAIARPLVSLLLLVLPGVSMLVAALREDRASATDLLTGTVLLPEE